MAKKKTELLEFYADWCNPCKAIAPVVEGIVKEFKLKLTTIDVDKDQETTQKYGVSSIPTLIVLEGGEEKARVVGTVPKALLVAKLGLNANPGT